MATERKPYSVQRILRRPDQPGGIYYADFVLDGRRIRKSLYTSILSEAMQRNDGLLTNSISILPDKLRAPMVAHFLNGLSLDAVAVNLGIPRRTVSYRINKGINHVRVELLARQES